MLYYYTEPVEDKVGEEKPPEGLLTYVSYVYLSNMYMYKSNMYSHRMYWSYVYFWHLRFVSLRPYSANGPA